MEERVDAKDVNETTASLEPEGVDTVHESSICHVRSERPPSWTGRQPDLLGIEWE